jgi:hypothetical protein
MKKGYALILAVILVTACTVKEPKGAAMDKVNIAGTWKLISGVLVEKGDTTVTDYTGNSSFIKIINDSHFAFMLHDLNQGKDSAAVYASGGGSYTINGNTYTEHLEYCSDRAWEGHDFTFEVTIKNDTLVQRGVEKIEAQGIDRLNIETYIKL